MRVAVTGAASGIGAATCKILKDRGDEVVAFDVIKPGKDVLENIDRFLLLDIADLASISEVLAKVDGRFDALMNIAGIPPRSGKDGESSGNEAQVLAVNFFGLRKFTLLLLDKLSDGAAIVSVASRAGSRWRENIAQVKSFLRLPEDTNLQEYCRRNGINPVRSYDLSKEAIIVWSMAQTEAFLERGLRINSISPAGVSTRILEDFREAFGKERVDKNTERAGRACLPEEAASVAVFMISKESAWIKGCDIFVDGGSFAMGNGDLLELSEFALVT
jgi:NAD(P)-dependent dehydrogenase (short-subunit alcohol dehydrogenase family)